jgi:hypothetical protein
MTRLLRNNTLLAFYLTGLLAALPASMLQAQIVTIGSGNAGPNCTTCVGPTNKWYEGAHQQFIITAAEINAAGGGCTNTITGLAFNHFAPPNAGLPNYAIKMKNTTATNPVPYDGTGLTTVYSNSSYLPAVASGWEMLTFQTNFAWNGTSNILVDVCFGIASPFNASGQVYTNAVAGGLASIKQDGVNLCGVAINVTSPFSPIGENPNYRPDVQLRFNNGGPVTYLGTTVAQANTLPILIGALNEPIISAGIKVCGTVGVTPNITSLTFTTGGTTNPGTDILNAKVYYTGNSGVFVLATATQVGTTVVNPSGSFTVTPFTAITMGPGNNFFWVVYDISPTATINNFVDATLTSFVLGGVTTTPTNGNPTGNRQIVNPYANLPYTFNFNNIWQNSLATRDIPSVNYKTTPATGNNSWRRENDGQVSGAWLNNFGNYTPTGSNANGLNGTGSSARFHSYGNTAGTTGDLDLFLNFSPAGTKVLDFDWINGSGSDQMDIYLSTDGGATFGPSLKTVTTAVGWQHEEFIQLGNSTSTTCVLRFRGNASQFSDDIGLDNVFVRVLPAVDASCMQVVGPPSSCSSGSAERVSAIFRNMGSNTLTSITVGYTVNGGPVVTETITGIALTSLDTLTYTFTTPVDLSPVGYYNIRVFSKQAGDGIISNDTAALYTAIHVPVINNYPYTENFDANSGFFRSYGVANTWAWGQPQKSAINSAASSPNCWVTGGLSTGTYNANEFSFLESPCFDFTNLKNPVISFNIWWRANPNGDAMALVGSTDGGITWDVIGSASDPAAWKWYNINNISTVPGPGGQASGWSGSTTSSSPPTSNGWTTAVNSLVKYAGKPNVKLRFAMVTDGFTQNDGFAIDNFKINEGPIVNLGPDRSVCQGDSSLVVAPSGFSAYLWSGQGSSNTATIRLKKPGAYFLRVTNAQGLFGYDTINLVISSPVVNLGANRQVCANVVEVLNVTNAKAQGYLWTDGFTGSVRSVTTPGTYGVTVTDSLGCKKTAQVTITHAPVPTVNIGNDTTFCTGSYLSLNAGNNAPGSTYYWSSNATTQRLLISGPGKYWVRVVSPFGCVGTDTINLTVKPSPVVYLGPDVFQCNNLNVTLDAGNTNATYFWSTGANTRTVNVTTPGIYYVDVINQIGCRGSDTVVVGANANLAPNLGPDKTVCGPTPIGTVRPAAAYYWNTGATTAQITPLVSGRYILRMTDAFGCIGLDTIYVTLLQKPNAAIASQDTVFLGQPVNFGDASLPTPDSWSWNFGDGSPSSSDQNPIHTYPNIGTYTVLLNAGIGGCTDTVSKKVVVVNFVSGINEKLSTVFEAYPNPTDQQLRVKLQLPASADVQLQLIALDGKVVWKGNYPKTDKVDEQLDVTRLSNGVYTLECTTGEQRLSKRIVVR